MSSLTYVVDHQLTEGAQWTSALTNAGSWSWSSEVNGVELADQFVREGFVRIDAAFSEPVAAQCRAKLWELLDASPDDPTSWKSPVVRLGYQSGGPFEQSVNTPRLHEAYDELVGEGRWMARSDVGTFAIRFPSDQAPGDDGWHIDSSFPPGGHHEYNDPFAWRVNITSRGRALLMLMLFSDVGEDDAPTRLRIGSHREAARILAPHGEEGLSMMGVSSSAASATIDYPEFLATGRAGNVYLCHPFMVHAAQRHRGTRVRFLAQPPLHLRGWIDSSFDVAAGVSPVELAIREAIRR